MKNLIKLLSIASLLVVTTFADLVQYNPTATTTTSVLQQAARIQQIQFANAATGAVTVTFTDAPTNVLTYVVGAYTNLVNSLSSATVTTWTNYSGVVNSYTNAVLTQTLTPVSATTNNYRTLLVQTIPGSSTITFTPPTPLPVGFGLAASTTATNVVATIIYLPVR